MIAGATNANKRAVYEPSNAERCRQLVCSKSKAVLVAVLLVLFAVVIALIAAFARPGREGTCVAPTTASPNLSPTTTEPVSTDGRAFPWKSIRLPADVVPHTYTLTMHPDLKTFQYKGEVAIKIEAKKATNYLVFHSKNLTITNYALFTTNSQDSELKKIRITKNLETKPHEQIYLELDEKLAVGQLYRLTMKFNGVLSEGLTGFYRSS